MGGKLGTCSKSFAAIILLGLLAGSVFLFAPQASYAATTTTNSNNTTQNKTEDAAYKEKINRCEELYPVYKQIGKSKFSKRYWSFVWERNCPKLYEHNVWEDKDNDKREQILIEVVKQTQGSSSALKQRHIPQSPGNVAIPVWIKEEAQRWTAGQVTQSNFAFLVRYMIDNRIVIPPLVNEAKVQQGCVPDALCIKEGDFVKYSYEIHAGQGNESKVIKDIATITHSFSKPDALSEDLKTTLSSYQGESADLLLVQAKKVSKEGVQRDQFYLEKNTGAVIDPSATEVQNCCKHHYELVHPVPLEKGDTLSSGTAKLSVQSDLVYPYKKFEKNSVLARHGTLGYSKVIDKDTGIVLHFKTTNAPIAIHPVGNTENKTNNYNLSDTSVLAGEYKHRPVEIKIPSWIKSPTEWWLSGQISDIEYVFLIEYLLKKNALIV